MATLVLGAVGSAIGGALLPGGVSLFGAAITGAAIGSAVGSVAGGFVDQALLGPLAGASGQTGIAQGPRLFDLKLGASSEGAVLPRVYGRVRLPGQLIWATRFKEVVKVTTQTGGGEAGGGKNALGSPSAGQGSKVKEYSYFANAAYAICEGPITRVGRIWADGKELDQSKYTIRVHRGDEAQNADGLIEAKEGGNDTAPPYRGTAYVVFDDHAARRFRQPAAPAQFRSVPRGRRLRGAGACGDDDPLGGGVHLRERPRHSDRERHDRRREFAHRAWRHRLEGLAGSARGAVAQCRPGVAGGELVRHRSPHRCVRSEAGSRGRRQGHAARHLVGGGRRARGGLCGFASE